MIRSILLVATALITACHANKNTTVNDVSESGIKQIIISSGGGVTGRYETYILHNDGLLEKMDGAGKTSPYGKIDLILTGELFHKAEELKMKPQKSYEPGNMNYTISIISYHNTKKIQWSDARNPDDDIITFYKSLMQHIRNLK